MKRKIILLLTIVSLIAWTGCEKSDSPPEKEEPNKENSNNEDPNKEGSDGPIGGGSEKVNVPHYLLSFTQPDKFDALAYNSPYIRLVYTCLPMEVDCFCSYRNEAGPEKDPQQAALYTALYKRYGDLTYDEPREYFNGYLTCIDHNYLMHNIVSINLISATDYDEAHPAGTSLNDICDLVSATPRQYIASGYADTYDWETNPDHYSEGIVAGYHGLKGSIPFRKRLSECTPEDMVLMGSGVGIFCDLIFTHRPTSGQKQRINITLTDESGTVYTVATRECEW